MGHLSPALSPKGGEGDGSRSGECRGSNVESWVPRFKLQVSGFRFQVSLSHLVEVVAVSLPHGLDERLPGVAFTVPFIVVVEINVGPGLHDDTAGASIVLSHPAVHIVEEGV